MHRSSPGGRARRRRPAGARARGGAGGRQDSGAREARPTAHRTGPRPAPRSGRCPNSAPRTFWVYLNMRNSQALDQTIAAVSDPSSPSYGQYLTPDQFRRPLRADDADQGRGPHVAAARGLRASAPTCPTTTAGSRPPATSSKVEKAFATQLRTYRTAAKTLPAPSGDLSVPRSISSRIAGIAGLDGSDRLMRPRTPGRCARQRRPSSTRRRARPTSGEKIRDDQYPTVLRPEGPPYAPCGYTPSAATRAPTAPTGLGRQGHRRPRRRRWRSSTPSRRRRSSQDANTVRDHATASRRGGSSSRSCPRHRSERAPTTVNGDQCGAQGWYGEETLDVEAVHAMAPGRQRRSTWAAPTACDDADCSTRSTRSSTATWPTSSPTRGATSARPCRRRTCAGLRTTRFRPGRARGHRLLLLLRRQRRRDRDNLGHAEVDFPASHPLVTAVGGTSLGVGKHNSYLFETGWGTDEPHSRPTAALGSGAARRPTCTARAAAPASSSPSRYYQKGVVPNDARQANGGQPAPRGPGRRDGRRPEHRHARRPDADVPRRDAAVRRVPHRRHQPLLAAVSRASWPSPTRQAGRRARLRQPGDLRASTARRPTATSSRPTSRSRSCASTSPTAVDAADGIKTTLRTFDHDESAEHPAGLRRRHRRRQPERAEVPRRAGRGGGPLATMADTGPRLLGAAPRRLVRRRCGARSAYCITEGRSRRWPGRRVAPGALALVGERSGSLSAYTRRTPRSSSRMTR